LSLSINPHNPYAYNYISATRTSGFETKQTDPSVISQSDAANFAQPRANSVALLVSDNAKRALLNFQESGETDAPSGAMMNTNMGMIDYDLDSYYANDPVSPKGPVSLDDFPPLLLPSAENIEALSNHASKRFQQLLEDYDIPSAPEKITFDDEGKMQIPRDYPYANELKQAFEDNPGLERELRDINAISSHFAALQERVPLIEEMSNAKSQAQIDQILMKYAHLLDDSVRGKKMALVFSENGQLGITADGKLLDFAAGPADRAVADSDKSSIETDTSNATQTTEPQTSSDAVKAFLDYMNKTPAERYFEALLAEEGLTKEELEALPPEKRAEIEEKIQRKMKERVEEGTGETIASAARMNAAYANDLAADWNAENGAEGIDNRLAEMLVPGPHANEANKKELWV